MIVVSVFDRIIELAVWPLGKASYAGSLVWFGFLEKKVWIGRSDRRMASRSVKNSNYVEFDFGVRYKNGREKTIVE